MRDATIHGFGGMRRGLRRLAMGAALLALPWPAISPAVSPALAQAPATAPAATQVPAIPAPRVTETVPPAASVLFVGNSFFYYNNGISNHLAGLVRASGQSGPTRFTMATIGGSGLDWHDVEAYFRPNAVGRYSIGGDNVVRFIQPSPLFDAAVMMDCSQCPVHPDLRDSFFATARRHVETVRRHGARPVLFMSWAYADKPEMTAELAAAYVTAGNDNEALVIPAGLAFARVMAEHPGIGLYTSDKRHPSVAGTYLAASTTFATLFGRSPVGSSFTAGLDPEQARILQQAAWDSAQEFLRR